MIIFDQLRISDDGKSMFINAHVNKAPYFDNVSISKITICTEDQIVEAHPWAYGDDFIYQEELEGTTTTSVEPLYAKPKILSSRFLLDEVEENGGWKISIDDDNEDDGTEYAVSVLLSGKFPAFDTGYNPILLATNATFEPGDSVSSTNPNVLFRIEGQPYENEQNPSIWQFKGKNTVGSENEEVYFYLYKQTSQGVYEYVGLDTTDNNNHDYNYLHFLWNVYTIKEEENHREVNLVLSANDFNNGKFTASDLSHNMFFVYVECEYTGTPNPCTPCRLDELTTLGVTFDYGVVFNQAMNYTRELKDSCSVSNNFTDFILNFDALKLAIETEHYVPAIQYWKNMTGNSGV